MSAVGGPSDSGSEADRSTFLLDDDVAFEAWCTRHPERASALRRLRTQWRAVMGLTSESATALEPPANSLGARLREQFGTDVDPGITLDPPEMATSPEDFSSRFLKQLAEHSDRSWRYRLRGEVAQGGQGAVLHVWDSELRRNLAMKVTLGRIPSPQQRLPAEADATPPVTRQQVARFLEEALVTGQLDHPGIVPVHELGLDATGRVFFTMKLVRGEDLRAVLQRVHRGESGWTVTRALGLLLRACEAMAYAHDKGVIHRDLKPANIMVGRFGEVYVMDWGLARVLGRPDTRDLRLRPDAATTTVLHSERHVAADDASPLVTMEGDVVGTPAYMPPEQARGHIEELSPAADVYALGAILYHLLSGHMPFVLEGAQNGPRRVLARLEQGPPAPLHERAPGAPAELIAICERAMARDARDRYASVIDLAEDLRAYVEQRVVKAYETGAVAELRKWIVRNRALATAMVAVVVLLAAGFAGLAWLSGDLATANEVLATRSDELTVALRRESEASSLAEQRRVLAEAERDRARWRSWLALAHMEFAEDPEMRAMILREVPASDDEFFARRAAESTRAEYRRVATLRGHTNQVNGAVWSPDGSRILTISDDMTARLWRADGSGESTALVGHTDAVTAANWSPDGTRIVTTSDDLTARVWSAASGMELSVHQGHEKRLSAAAWSPDGARIATASLDHTVRIWKVEAGGGEPLVLIGHEDYVNSVAWSPDGARVVTASDDGTARVWSADGSHVVLLRGHGNSVKCAAWSPDGKHIVTASDDSTSRVWDAVGGSELAVLASSEGGVRTAEWSPDGTRIVTTAGDDTMRIWSMDAGADQNWMYYHDHGVNAAVWSPDGNYIVAVFDDGIAKLFRSNSTDTQIVLRGSGRAMQSAAWSPDATRIVTTSADETAVVWSVDGTSEPAVLRGHESTVSCADWSPDGTHIASASMDGSIRVWRAAGEHLSYWWRGHEGWVNSVAWSPDGSRLLTASMDKMASIWTVGSDQDPVQLQHADAASHASWSPDGTRIVTVAGNAAFVWQADGGGEPLVLSGHGDRLVSAAWSPDGRRIVTASMDCTARVWHAESGREVTVLEGHVFGVLSAAWSPDGTRIATASADNSMRIWRADGRGATTILRGHEGPVYSVAWSPDGSRIVTGSADRTACIWAADGSGTPVVLRGHPGWVLCAAWSPDGTRVVTASNDGTARIWTPDWPALRARLWEIVPDVLSADERVEFLDETEDRAAAAWVRQQAERDARLERRK